ncbi:MAG: hypothetical protein KKG04_02325 [Candidatus Thermoplasmatota archaeon]|nr:hypothetical protein [Candidatus Thermoplasmatota archaeon]
MAQKEKHEFIKASVQIDFPGNVADSMNKIIDYLFYDEKKNYLENPCENHIWHDVKTVHDWLEKK